MPYNVSQPFLLSLQSFYFYGESMQTIIYTNNKREGSNYEVDRVVYSEEIEVGHLIEQEMQRYSISHIHLWFVRENVNSIEQAKEAALLVNIGKYLIDNKDSNFKFEYIVEKYQESQQKKQTKMSDSQCFYRNGDISESITEKMSTRQEKTHLLKEEIIKQEIKFGHFREFEVFIKKELSSNLDEQQIIKKYIFQTREETIGVSFFRAGQKEFIYKIIEEECNQIFNAKLNYRKISTIHPEDYEKNKKKMESYEKPIQLYHRVILYLFSHSQKGDDVRDPKRKKTCKPTSSVSKNLSNEGLQPWKTELQVQSLIKYKKQCELIAQQIENQKIIFRNKIKLIENYIGDTINVEKLFQEQEDLQNSNPIIQQMSNNAGPTPLKKVPFIGKRASIAPAITQTITNNLSKFNNTLTNPSFLNVTEFKRLKDISEAMRNIDNTIFEQNKKIEALKSKAKELVKFKEEILFKNAKEFNVIKRQILELTREVERKQHEIQEKRNKGQFETFLHYKNKEPSQKAKESLNQHIKFVSLHQKPQIAQKKDFTLYDDKDNKDQQQRSTNRSHHRMQFKEIVNSSMLRFREKKKRQVEKTKQTMKNPHLSGDIIHPFYSTDIHIRYKTAHMAVEHNQNSDSSAIVDRQLVQLYHYYLKNAHIIKQINKQTSSFNCLNQDHMNMNKKHTNSQNMYKTTVQKDQTLYDCDMQMNLEDYPILKNILPFDGVDNQRLNASTFHKKNPPFYQQSPYPKDLFDVMIVNDKNKSLKMRTKDDSLRSSLKQAENDHVTEHNMFLKTVAQQQNLQKQATKQKGLFKPSILKRITIEQTINGQSLVKRVKMNDTA